MQNIELCAIFRLLLMISPPTLNVMISSLRVDCLKIGTTFWSSARSLSSVWHTPSCQVFLHDDPLPSTQSYCDDDSKWTPVDSKLFNTSMSIWESGVKMRKWYEFNFLDLLFFSTAHLFYNRLLIILTDIHRWWNWWTFWNMHLKCRATKAEPCSHPNCSLIKKLFSYASKCKIRM